MSAEAAREIGEGIAWLGFWVAGAVVICVAMAHGWRPWE